MMHVGRGSSGSINRQWRGSNGRGSSSRHAAFSCSSARTHAGSTWRTIGQGDGTVKAKKVMLGKRVELGMTVDKRVEPVVDVVLGVEVVGRHVDMVAKQVAANVVIGRKAMPRRERPSRPARSSR